nr:unnamed protein product [Spirometra erinaceieuropaei]
MIESSCLLLVHRPGLRSIQQRQQDDRHVHFQFDVELQTMAIPDSDLQTAEGLAGFGYPAGHFTVDRSGAGEGAAQADIVAGDDEEVRVRLHVTLRGDVKSSFVGEEKLLKDSCGYTRLEMHLPLIEEVVIHLVGDAEPRAFVTMGVHKRGREHEVRRKDAALLLSVDHYECI